MNEWREVALIVACLAAYGLWCWNGVLRSDRDLHCRARKRMEEHWHRSSKLAVDEQNRADALRKEIDRVSLN